MPVLPVAVRACHLFDVRSSCNAAPIWSRYVCKQRFGIFVRTAVMRIFDDRRRKEQGCISGWDVIRPIVSSAATSPETKETSTSAQGFLVSSRILQSIRTKHCIFYEVHSSGCVHLFSCIGALNRYYRHWVEKGSRQATKAKLASHIWPPPPPLAAGA